MKRILGFLRPYARRMGLGFAIKFVGTIGELWLPWILTHMINEIVPLQKLSLIFLWGGLMVLCSGVCVAANVTGQYTVPRMRAVINTLTDLFIQSP